MSENRLSQYLDHIQQAATDACGFVEGMAKDHFLSDKRTQQAVIMSLIIIGEAATKVMDSHAEYAQAHPEVSWRSMRGMRKQPHRPRLFRHQPRRGVEHGASGAAGIAEATIRHAPGCRQRRPRRRRNGAMTDAPLSPPAARAPLARALRAPAPSAPSPGTHP
jgi:uncharacterized protein with HEPN domain